MNKILIDANNISNISYHKARSIMLLERKEKTKNLEGSELEEMTQKINKKITNNLAGFATKIFFNIFHKYIKDNSNHRFYLIWDGKKGSSWRKEYDEKYKSNRDHSKDKFYNCFLDSLTAEKDILDNYPVIQLGFLEAEADDLIYNLCELFTEDSVIVFSGDGDLVQLAQKFNNVKIWHPRNKEIVEVPDYDIVLFKSISGDKSDNIDGLYKYGEKKTMKAINENLCNLTKKQLDTIEKNKILIDLSLNPNNKKNKQKIIKRLQESKINKNMKKVKKLYFNYKLAEFLRKWSLILELLSQLEEESLNGGKKEN